MIQTGNRLARWRGIGCGKAYLEPCLATQLNHPPPKTMARVRGQGQGGIKGSSKGLDPSLHSLIIAQLHHQTNPDEWRYIQQAQEIQQVAASSTMALGLALGRARQWGTLWEGHPACPTIACDTADRQWAKEIEAVMMALTLCMSDA